MSTARFDDGAEDGAMTANAECRAEIVRSARSVCEQQNATRAEGRRAVDEAGTAGRVVPEPPLILGRGGDCYENRTAPWPPSLEGAQICVRMTR